MYREVTTVEITEVLRLWRDGVARKRIAAQLGLDPKTVRRYISTIGGIDLSRDSGALTDAQVRGVLLALHPAGGRPHPAVAAARHDTPDRLFSSDSHTRTRTTLFARANATRISRESRALFWRDNAASRLEAAKM